MTRTRDLTKARVLTLEAQQRYESIRGLARTLARGSTVGEVIETILENLRSRFPDCRLCYSTVDATDNLLVVRSIAAPHLGDLTGFRHSLSDTPELLRRLRAIELIEVEDLLASDLHGALGAMMVETGALATVQVPLQRSEQLVGLLCVDSPVPRSWGGDILELLGFAAALLETVLDRVEETVAVRAARDSARVASARLETLANGLDVGVLLEDEGRTVLFANQAYAEMFGAPDTNAAIGRPSANAAKGVGEAFADADAFVAGVDAIVAAAQPVRAQRLELRDGRLLERDYLPLQLDGDARGHLWEYRDVTRQEAFKERFSQSERLAALGTIAAAIAHELNNPLTYVLATVQHARERIAGPWTEAGLTELLRQAENGALRIRSIVQGLRSFVRPDTSRSVVGLSDAIDVAVATASSELRHRARLVCHLRETPAVSAPAGVIEHIIVSLLLNASDAAAETGGARGSVRLETGLEQDGRIFIEVADDGPEVAPAAEHELFEPFASSGTLRHGSGLGLFVTRQSVIGLGGEISVTRAPEGGAAFRVRLPAATPDDAPPGEPATTSTATLRPRATVLIVDDEARVGSALARLLQDSNDVVVLDNANDALTRLEASQAFDAILCDVLMPGIDGVEFYERLRQISPALAERTVFITGGGVSRETERRLQAFGTQILHKPLTADELRGAVQRVVAHPR